MSRADRHAGDSSHSRTVAEFTEFYRREQPTQVRRAKLLVGSNELANDLVHDAFATVFQRWNIVKEPGAYLNRIVVNACRDNARHRATVSRANQRIGRAPADAPHDVLWDVLAELPFNQRACVVLRFYAGMNEREIAETLACKPGSVGPWTTRALRTMRKALS